ncbi:hypothetical protein L2E82_35851 [Cichorium intybus]|uniref:Uncharacterized protein n=1 Tax=Cichorium intybus TaxID=13427 RepID=A0ACB9BPX6_CICIN|nr:hypothetical protein L2E82_35851 [Cichorium intybus]
MDFCFLLLISCTSNSVPEAFPGQLTVTILSLLGNRLSGPIPREIGDIATLEELVLEDNLLQGQLPSSLGRLTGLRRILLSANNFTGTIPETYGNLTNLEDFGIVGSTLSGRIPSFIGNWTRLIRVDWQGTSMEGPIPSTISLLRNLEELVKAAFVVSDPVDWSRDFQVLYDILRSGGLLGEKCQHQPHMYFAADHLEYQLFFLMKVLAWGAFRIALESIFNKIHHKPLELNQLLNEYHKHKKSENFETLYMIGDNREVDIKGARRVCLEGKKNHTDCPADQVVDTVEEAVEYILQKEGKCGDPSAEKKPGVVWSIDLQTKFIASVNQLGIEKAVPKRNLDLMNVDGIIRENVASHLQMGKTGVEQCLSERLFYPCCCFVVVLNMIMDLFAPVAAVLFLLYSTLLLMPCCSLGSNYGPLYPANVVLLSGPALIKYPARLKENLLSKSSSNVVIELENQILLNECHELTEISLVEDLKQESSSFKNEYPPGFEEVASKADCLR